MTGELPTRYGVEPRPSRSNIHLLHSAKTDEIEVLESGALSHHTNIGNGSADHSRTKVSIYHPNYSAQKLKSIRLFSLEFSCLSNQ